MPPMRLLYSIKVADRGVRIGDLMPYTLEDAKLDAAKILQNLVHYPKQKRTFYSDDVTTIAIALVKAAGGEGPSRERHELPQ